MINSDLIIQDSAPNKIERSLKIAEKKPVWTSSATIWAREKSVKKIPEDHRATLLSFLGEMTEESNAGCIKAQNP